MKQLLQKKRFQQMTDAVYTTLVLHDHQEIFEAGNLCLKVSPSATTIIKAKSNFHFRNSLTRFEEDVIVDAFIRNTLEKAVRFEMVDLLLVDEDSQAFG